MPRIDFYILNNQTPKAQFTFACKLIEKAYKQQHSLHILTRDQQTSQQMDDLLWTFRDGSFVPHEIFQSAKSRSPVLVGWDFSAPQASPENNSVLVNLSQTIPGYFKQYQRITEIVSADANSRQLARERFGYYRKQGFEPESHPIN